MDPQENPYVEACIPSLAIGLIVFCGLCVISYFLGAQIPWFLLPVVLLGSFGIGLARVPDIRARRLKQARELAAEPCPDDRAYSLESLISELLAIDAGAGADAEARAVTLQRYEPAAALELRLRYVFLKRVALPPGPPDVQAASAAVHNQMPRNVDRRPMLEHLQKVRRALDSKIASPKGVHFPWLVRMEEVVATASAQSLERVEQFQIVSAVQDELGVFFAEVAAFALPVIGYGHQLFLGPDSGESREYAQSVFRGMGMTVREQCRNLKDAETFFCDLCALVLALPFRQCHPHQLMGEIFAFGVKRPVRAGHLTYRIWPVAELLAGALDMKAHRVYRSLAKACKKQFAVREWVAGALVPGQET